MRACDVIWPSFISDLSRKMLDKVTLSKVVWQVAQEEDREVKLKCEPFERMRSSLFIL